MAKSTNKATNVIMKGVITKKTTNKARMTIETINLVKITRQKTQTTKITTNKAKMTVETINPVKITRQKTRMTKTTTNCETEIKAITMMNNKTLIINRTKEKNTLLIPTVI